MEFRFTYEDTNETNVVTIPGTTKGKIVPAITEHITQKPVIVDEEVDVISVYIPSKEDDFNVIGDWVKKARTSRKWTQSQLAKISQVSLTLVSKTEQGAIVPSVKGLGSIVTALLFWDSSLPISSGKDPIADRLNNISGKQPDTTASTPIAPTFNSEYADLKNDILNLTHILLSTDEYYKLELLKKTLESIERVESEIDKLKQENVGYMSGIDMLIGLYSDDFKKGLNKLKE